MKRKTIFISALVLVFVLALFAFTACNTAESEEGVNLVTNGDFSTFTSENKFEGWTTSSSSVSFARVQRSDSESGDNVLKIENKSAGYSYLKQSVKVEVNKIYKVTVDMKIDAELSNKQGAYVSFLENVEYKFVTLYLTGQISYEKMRTDLATAIHQFAKRQMTWFRGMERKGIRIHWVQV